MRRPCWSTACARSTVCAVGEAPGPVEATRREGDQAARRPRGIAQGPGHSTARQSAKSRDCARRRRRPRCGRRRGAVSGTHARALARYADEAERQVTAATGTQNRADAESRLKGVQEIARQAREAMESADRGARAARRCPGGGAGRNRGGGTHAADARVLAGDWRCLNRTYRTCRAGATDSLSLSRRPRQRGSGEAVQALERSEMARASKSR